MSIHFFIHNGVCRLRRLLGLGPVNCTRCDSERSSRRVVETSGSVDFGPVPTFDSSLIPELKAGYTSGKIEDATPAPEWNSFRVHRDVRPSPRGLNRQFFQYDIDGSAVAITRTFNAYCSEHGVQCTVTMDPSDYEQIFLFKNVSDCLVQITHQGVVRQIAPGEHVTMKVDDVLNPLGVDDLYKLTQWSLPQIETIHGALS